MFLREKDKQTLLTIFSELKIPVEVWAYGSRVNGSAHEASDLDLVIRSANVTRLPYDVFIELREKISDTTIPILIELHDWATLPQSFHQNILQRYEVLFDNRNEIAVSE